MKFKVGDEIQCIDERENGGFLTKHRVYKISEILSHLEMIRIIDDTYAFGIYKESQFKPMGHKRRQTMKLRYNIGDKVKVLRSPSAPQEFIGKIYEITMTFPESREPHYRLSNGYYYDDSEVELAKPSRGFQRIQGFDDIPLPTRATKHSAGYDISAVTDITLAPGKFQVFPTGLKVYMEPDEVFQIYIRSSLGIKHRIKLMNSTCIIDADYYENEDNDGHFVLALENCGTEVFSVHKGTKIAQGIFSKYLVTDEDQCDKERNGGIGSTTV